MDNEIKLLKYLNKNQRIFHQVDNLLDEMGYSEYSQKIEFLYNRKEMIEIQETGQSHLPVYTSLTKLPKNKSSNSNSFQAKISRPGIEKFNRYRYDRAILLAYQAAPIAALLAAIIALIKCSN